MSDKIPKITMFKGESYPIKADFRAKAKKIGANATGVSSVAETSGVVTVGAESITGNIASILITADAVGCAVVTSTATTADPYSMVGKVEIEVIDPTECSS